MIKIIFGSIALILLVLAINSFWFSGGLDKLAIGKFKINPPREGLVQNLQEVPKTLSQKAIEGMQGAVKGAQTSLTEYFMQKTGREVVDLIKDLPDEQQEVIKKEYCSK